MHIIEIKALYNGAHNQMNGFRGDAPPDGWAIIPDNMELPKTFPFVGVVVEEETRRRTKFSPDGEETTEEYTVLVVSSMTEGVVPDPDPEPDPVPTQLDRVEAQATYTAMMTDTLLEG